MILNKVNKYLVNEEDKTFTLSEEIVVDLSIYISSVQNYQNHIIIESRFNA